MNIGLKEISIIMGLVYSTIIPAGAFLDGRWNQNDKVNEAIFCAYSNKEQYLKMKLDDLCRKYGKVRYPCSPDGMREEDRVDFIQYEKWYRDQQDQIKGILKKHG